MDFNTMGELIARYGKQARFPKLAAAHPFAQEHFIKDNLLDEERLMDYLAQHVGGGWCRKTGNVWKLGEVHGFTLYGALCPQSNDYLLHDDDQRSRWISLANNPHIPEQMRGRVRLLSDCAFIWNDRIQFAPEVIASLLPAVEAPTPAEKLQRLATARRIRACAATTARTPLWKRCLTELVLAAAARGDAQPRPPSMAREIVPWFATNAPPSLPHGIRTLQRDLDKLLGRGTYRNSKATHNAELIWLWHGFTNRQFLLAAAQGHLPHLSGIVKSISN